MATKAKRTCADGLGRLLMVVSVAALMSLLTARPEAASPIGCGAVLNGSSTYTLTADVLDCSGAGPAITVVGPAKLRLNGFTVSCEHTIDLEVDPDELSRPFPHTRTLTPDSIGILLDGSGASLLGAGQYTTGANDPAENRVLGCDNNVVLEGNGNHQVIGVHSIQSGAAAFLVASNRNKLTGNIVRQHFIDADFYGVALGDDPRPARCEQSGLVVEGDYNELVGNLAADCYESGFQVEGTRNYFEGNTARDNDEHGFLIEGDYNTLARNVAAKNIESGFFVAEGVRRNTIDHNLASQNGDGEEVDGFEIRGNENIVKANMADNNGKYGISVYGARNEISENTASSSEDTDLYDDTAGCGTSKWSKNLFGSSNQLCIK